MKILQLCGIAAAILLASCAGREKEVAFNNDIVAVYNGLGPKIDSINARLKGKNLEPEMVSGLEAYLDSGLASINGLQAPNPDAQKVKDLTVTELQTIKGQYIPIAGKLQSQGTAQHSEDIMEYNRILKQVTDQEKAVMDAQKTFAENGDFKIGR